MHFKYHAAIGLIGEGVCALANVPSSGLFFLVSVAPDFPLLPNEIRLRIGKGTFREENVSGLAHSLYMLAHSSLLTLLLLLVSPVAAAAHLIHTVADWFTHVGRFATMPLYPISRKQISFGRNILK